MNNISITAVGNCVTEPVFFEKDAEKPAMSSFRLASAPSYYSSKTKSWQQGETTWLDVKTTGALATHVAKSVKKGDPVFAAGALRTRKYTTKEGVEGETNTIIATAVGHNLLMGNTDFSRSNASDEEIASSIPETVETIDADE